MSGPTPTARRRTVAAIALAVTLLTAAGCDRGDHPEHLSTPAPLFTISDGHTTIDLAQLRGKVVVLNLWATWCVPCLQELPSLLELHQRMPQLAIVGIALDRSDDIYRRFLVKNNVGIPTVRDADGRINALYGTALLPETYIIDKDGILRRKLVSAQDWTSPEIMNYLAKLQAQPA